MTNAQIIFNQSIALMEQGIISGTGETMIGVDSKGNPVSFEMPEPIHTYKTWQSLGYQVRKGEKAIAKFAIWKFIGGGKSEKAESEEDATETVTTGKKPMIMKVSAFFKASQVEKK